MRAPTLAQFKSEVESLLPPDRKLKSLEVYIGELTAPQLSYLFELISKVEGGEMVNLIFWKVSFLN